MEVLLKRGKNVVAPVAEGSIHRFLSIENAKDADLGYFQAEGSMKGFFLPATEGILKFTVFEREPRIEEPDLSFPEIVVVGSRPCDAAALPIQDKVFEWDVVDMFYKRRRERTTVVSIACAQADSDCFCTSMELAPDSHAGSDLLLIKNGEEFLLEVVTAKGEELVGELNLKVQTEPPNREAMSREAAKLITREFPAEKIQNWLAGHFLDPLWEEMCSKCIGCAACTFVCPTCHCFDIVDEPVGTSGERRKNWDACTLWHFTVHASGHNPRNVQYKRYRQRIMHKFNYYRERFGTYLCTGCGRCIRACPVSLDLALVLEEISARAG